MDFQVPREVGEFYGFRFDSVEIAVLLEEMNNESYIRVMTV